MNKIVLILNIYPLHFDEMNLPQCLIFNNIDDAKDWFKKYDFSEVSIQENKTTFREELTAIRYGCQKLTGFIIKGKAYL